MVDHGISLVSYLISTVHTLAADKVSIVFELISQLSALRILERHIFLSYTI